jgi:hypothetical protein
VSIANLRFGPPPSLCQTLGGREICYRAADERINVLDHGQPPGAGRRFPDGKWVSFQKGFADITVWWMVRATGQRV